MNTIYHNRKTIRLKNYYYTKGIYFITICTKNREKILSEIKPVGADDSVRHSTITVANAKQKNNNRIIQPILTPIGKIINEKWYKMQQIYDNVKLWEFIIMPDHIHGILELEDGRTGSSAPTENCTRI